MSDQQTSHPAYQPMVDQWRARSEAPRREITAADRIAAELLISAIPLGWGFRALRGLHWAAKGARWNAQARRYQAIRATPGIRGRPFVSKVDYSRRYGLPRYAHGVAKLPHKAVKTARAELHRRFPVPSRIYSGYRMVTDPGQFLLRKYVPYYGLAVGVAAGYKRGRDISRWVRDRIDGDGEPSRPDPAGQMSKTVKNPLARSTHNTRTRSQNRGCPPGHRWSSSARKCVPLRRNRA